MSGPAWNEYASNYDKAKWYLGPQPEPGDHLDTLNTNALRALVYAVLALVDRQPYRDLP